MKIFKIGDCTVYKTVIQKKFCEKGKIIIVFQYKYTDICVSKFKQ